MTLCVSVSVGDVLYELLQHILKQRKASGPYPSSYLPRNSLHPLQESSIQHLKLKGQSHKCFFLFFPGGAGAA